jgi:hypothetical protein
MTVPGTSTGDAAKFTEGDGAALALALEPSERAELVIPAVGSTIILTDRRLLVVRQGAARRPRTGVQSWDIDDELMVRLGPRRMRVLIGRQDQFLSIFLRADQVPEVEHLINEIADRRTQD